MADRVTTLSTEAAQQADGTLARITALSTEAAQQANVTLARITALSTEAAQQADVALARVTALSLEYAWSPPIIIAPPPSPSAQGTCGATVNVTTRNSRFAATYILERSDDGVNFTQIYSVTP